MTSGRRAGVGRLSDGRVVTWSMADGGRGRRWRTATRHTSGALDSTLLLELDPDSALSKAELATPNGLLSLHPEGDHLHGNVVTEGGVRHLQLGWSAEHVLVIEGSSVSLAAAAVRAAPDGAGERQTVPAIVVRADLSVDGTAVAFERVDRNAIDVDVDGTREVLELDELGIPATLRSGGSWPLELD